MTTQTIRDRFDRADAATLGAADLGGIWTQCRTGGGASAVGIAGGLAVATTPPAAGETGFAVLDTGEVDHWIEADVVLGQGTAGLTVRSTGAVGGDGVLLALIPGTAVVLADLVGGAVVSTTTRSGAPADGRWRLEVDGPTVSAYRNGTLVLSASTSLAAGSAAGIAFGEAPQTSTIDDVVGGTIQVGSGPCEPWCSEADVEACCTGLLDTADLVGAIDLASEILWYATGQRWGGLCVDQVRPCSRTSLYSPAWPFPGGTMPLYDWAWAPSWGVCDCNRGESCGCNRLSEITLGAFPVDSIIAVMVDGVLLPSTAYRLDEHRLLVRIDGDVWPCCQDLSLPSTELDTFEVTFWRGERPSRAGSTVAARYACEIAKAACGVECELPSRVTQVVRQGVTFNMRDPAAFIPNGLTGVSIVDNWIVAANGGRPRPPRPATISSPDVGRRVRRVGR